jgi:hypothetical protein
MSLKVACWKLDHNRKASDYLAISPSKLQCTCMYVASRLELGTVHAAHLLQAKKTHLINASLLSARGEDGNVTKRLDSRREDLLVADYGKIAIYIKTRARPFDTCLGMTRGVTRGR